MNPAALTSQALLNCLIREVSIPERQAWERDGQLLIRLARSGPVLRARLRRASAGLGPRVAGDVQVRRGLAWTPIGWEDLATLIAGELSLATGVTNDEFTGQVRGSHTALATILRARQVPRREARGAPRPIADRYLASEQALVAGHRFHPAPKARSGRGWLRYAPEAGARFPLRFLGVRADVLAAEGDTSALDRLGGPAAPPGYRLLPAHPWQLRLLDTRLEPARRAGLLIDLGPGAQEVAPTSSVRTVYDPRADVFAKFSLNVRITNCVRTSAWYELAGSVLLTRLLAPVFEDVRTSCPGTVLLGEPGYRTVALAQQDLYQGLAVIARDGLRDHLAPGVTPVLAAALTEPALTEPALTEPALTEPALTEPALTGPAVAPFAGRDPDWLLGWWEAYVGLLAPPVLHLLFAHGVVLEPHLQNVLAGLDAGDWPAQVVLRDLEGVKLVAARHEAVLATLPPRVARGLAYDRERGWNRVAYCLFVNHLAEVAAAIADTSPGQAERLETELWRRARQRLTGFARDHGWTPELRALLSGVPLPAKANLKVRWARAADREACYVPVRNPLTEPFTGPFAEPSAVPSAVPVPGPLTGPRRPAPRAAARTGPAVKLPAPVRDLAIELARDEAGLPAYVYDLAALDAHAAGIRAALAGRTELYYAVKANPDPDVLRTVARHADGLEVSSAGELRHAAAAVPESALAFGGPGKTAADLATAVRAGVHRVHVESPHELAALAEAARGAHRPVQVLFRVNPPVPVPSGAGVRDLLLMGGTPSPFGMTGELLEQAANLLRPGQPAAGLVELRGLHAHLASGQGVAGALHTAGEVLAFGRRWCARHGVDAPEFTLGGGMAVDYDQPESRFGWAGYGRGLAALARPGETLRIEPGRAVTAYCGWYLTRVLDVKPSHGRAFAVVTGGTHHLRTPAAKGHSQPFAVVPVDDWVPSWPRPGVTGKPVTIAGQLCTPKDVLARDVPVPQLRAGDLVAFGLAGAYAWNISHHDFLMHPVPAFHYLKPAG